MRISKEKEEWYKKFFMNLALLRGTSCLFGNVDQCCMTLLLNVGSVKGKYKFKGK